jgi:ATP-dependent Zn protease
MAFPILSFNLVSLCLGIDNGGAVKINAKSNVKKRIIVSTALSTGILFLFLALFWYIWKKKQQKKGKSLRS